MLSRISLVAGLLVALLLPATAPLTAMAHDHDTPSSAGSPPTGSSPTRAQARTPAAIRGDARSYFTDLPVIAQDGKERRFFSDVLKDKVVLIYLFYTNCKATCPVINQKLAGVQDLLGDHLGSDVVLISITTDPVHDTPSVIKEYSEHFGPRPGWLFLTGDVPNVENIVRRLGHTSPDPNAHSTFLTVGNVAKAQWTRLRPTASEAEIAEMLRLLAGDRKE